MQHCITKLSTEVAKRVPFYINLVAMTLQKQEFKCLVLQQYYEHTTN